MIVIQFPVVVFLLEKSYPVVDGYCKVWPIDVFHIGLDVIVSPTVIIPVVFQQMVFSSQMVFQTYHVISSVFCNELIDIQLVIPVGSLFTACQLGCFWIDFNSIVKLFHIALPSVFFHKQLDIPTDWLFQRTRTFN